MVLAVHFLNFGRKLELTSPIHTEQSQEPGTEVVIPKADTESVRQYLNQLRFMTDRFKLVSVNLDRACSNQSRYFNLRRREWRCHVEDFVMKKKHVLSCAVKRVGTKYSGSNKIF